MYSVDMQYFTRHEVIAKVAAGESLEAAALGGDRLSGANLHRAILGRANLSWANLYEAEMNSA